MTEVTTVVEETATPGPGPADGADALRANLYALLANLLAGAPKAELLGVLASIELPEDGADSPLGEAWAMLRAVAGKATPERLADEYQDVFIGIGRGEVVPYGSWYLTGFLMEKPLALLRDDLDRLGFKRQEHVSESEDHIAALCDVMGMISGDGGVANAEQQAAFFAAHLAAWESRFFEDLQNAPSARFYRVVGFLGERFMSVESKYLDVRAEPVERRAAT